jgi:hypothetical protein
MKPRNVAFYACFVEIVKGIIFNQIATREI